MQENKFLLKMHEDYLQCNDRSTYFFFLFRFIEFSNVVIGALIKSNDEMIEICFYIENK